MVGGGDSAIEEATLPHQVRQQGHPGPPPRRAAGLARSCRTGPSPTPRSSFAWNSTVVGDRRRARRSRRIVLEDTVTGERRDLAVTGAVRRHRPHAQHRPVQGPARAGGERLPGHRTTGRRHQRRGRLRLRRRAGPHLPPGHHGRRLRLHGRHRRRALARGPGRPLSIDGAAGADAGIARPVERLAATVSPTARREDRHGRRHQHPHRRHLRRGRSARRPSPSSSTSGPSGAARAR